PHEGIGDGLLNLLLADRVQERAVFGQPPREDVVHRHATALDDMSVRGVFVAEIEVEEAAAPRRAAAARIALGLVVAHPPVEDGDLVARGDGPRALDASLTVGEDRRVGVAAVVAQPAAGHAGVRDDDEPLLREERELRLGGRDGLGIARVDLALPRGIGNDHVSGPEGTACEDAPAGDRAVAELDRRQTEHRFDAPILAHRGSSTMFEGSKVRSGLAGAPEPRDGPARALVRAWWRLGVRCLRARGRLRSHVSRGIDACGPDLARPALRALRACVARAWPRPFGSHLAGRMVGPFGSRLAG